MTTPAKWKPPTAPRAAGPMTELDTAAIRARAEAAPEGEWFVQDDGSVWVAHDPEHDSCSGLTGAFPIWAHGAAEFIAHARTDVPALLDEVDALSAKVGDATIALLAAEDAADLAAERGASALREVGDVTNALHIAEAERDAARAVIERVRAALPWLSAHHAHDVPGIWNSDNGDRAGTACEECALVWAARSAILDAAGGSGE